MKRTGQIFVSNLRIKCLSDILGHGAGDQISMSQSDPHPHTIQYVPRMENANNKSLILEIR